MLGFGLGLVFICFVYMVCLAFRVFSICFAVVPSPKGLGQVLGFCRIVLAAFWMRFGSVPARMFASTVTVSGRSVLSLRVMQGTFRMQVSSWTPPESVKTSFALLSNTKNER